MEYGPVPSTALNIMSDVISGDPQFPPVAKALFDEYLIVEKRWRRKYHEFRSRKPADREVFSESDIEALEQVIAEHGTKTAWQLSEESHSEPAWQSANSRRQEGSSVMMDYRDFFIGAPDAEAMLELIESQQDDRDFATAV